MGTLNNWKIKWNKTQTGSKQLVWCNPTRLRPEKSSSGKSGEDLKTIWDLHLRRLISTDYVFFCHFLRFKTFPRLPSAWGRVDNDFSFLSGPVQSKKRYGCVLGAPCPSTHLHGKAGSWAANPPPSEQHRHQRQQKRHWLSQPQHWGNYSFKYQKNLSPADVIPTNKRVANAANVVGVDC